MSAVVRSDVEKAVRKSAGVANPFVAALRFISSAPMFSF